MSRLTLFSSCSFCVLSVSLVISFSGHSIAQELHSERQQFLSLVGSKLFGDDRNAYEVPGGRGWQTFAMSPFGSSTESLVEAYTEIDQRFAYSAARESTVDSVVSINDGVVVFLEESLPSIWSGILNFSRPRGSIEADRLLSAATLKWLFRPTGRYNTRGDLIFSREPSRFLKRYNEFKNEYHRLTDLEDNDAWRYVLPFSQYASFRQAIDAQLHNWETAGYKTEVEAAQIEFARNAQPLVYRRWAEANEKFNFFSEPYGGGLRNYETLILPSPASWPGLVDWRNIRYRPVGLGGEFRFQLAVVDVRRPWIDLEFLFELNELNEGVTDGGDVARVNLSEGIMPEFGASLNGRFVGMIDKIVLVRGIDWIDPNSLAPLADPPTDSSLGKFAYPQSINVLGYVVHIMPTISVPIDMPNYLLADDVND